MEIGIGLALAALTLYTSSLTFALRSYSRARLARRLSSERDRHWVDWYADFESELQVVAGFARLVAVMGTTLWVYAADLIGKNAPVTFQDVVRPSVTMLLVLLTFALGIPHALAMHNAEGVLAANRHALRAMRIALYPVERLLMGIEFIVRRLLGKGDTSEDEDAQRIEEEILDVVSEGEAQGAVGEEQKEMIESILELEDTPVSAVMTPRTEIVAMPVDATFEQARGMVVEGGHSRIPVYEQTLDHIVGVLYAKDLLKLRLPEGFELRRLMRPAQYVPETKPLDELLMELRAKRVHMAIVLDEYGGTAGLVTIEDILEEFVGEIDDEYDENEPPPIQPIDESTLEVDARVHIHEVNEELGVELPEDGEYDTIGGFVFSAMGKIPQKGDELTHENVRFEIVDAEPRKINRLRIHYQKPAGAQ